MVTDVCLYKLAVIGGTQEKTFKKIGKQAGFEILFDNAYKPKKDRYHSIITQADCVVIIVRDCSHKAMWLAKRIAKATNTPIRFSHGGATGAILDGAKACYTIRD